MLLDLLLPLHERLPALNVFRYITFRTAGAVLTALAICLLAGPRFIALLRRLSVGQNIREVGPASHQVKAGTPTMGGLLILVSLTGATLLWAQLRNPLVWLALAVTLGFGAVGFADDLLKVRRHRNLGLGVRAKLGGQFLVAGGAGLALWIWPEHFGVPASLTFPFFKGWVLPLGGWYVPFALVVLVSTSNGVNLTDGLDGLAIGAMLIAASTYAVFTYVAGHAGLARYLQVPYVAGVGEVAVFCGALAGASLGFLWFNAHPAEVFMGDVGSLALGGAIGTVALLSRQEIVLILVGGLFVIEAVSVILQVASFKATGRRIFRMAPLHHHFELGGWAESKVIARFWILSLVFALLGLSTLKLR
ncbi:MAG: phospho-N-acetylmuramoyl-pentapeptide-transferase [Holophagales bacterium]|jgi:phospho-N-acetylmuramoyl-pentapeptide-transferase|nr:MAG: phospho-N-acetylmuramoyl-pentapeptide-transferase [Holophagales bacterium]